MGGCFEIGYILGRPWITPFQPEAIARPQLVCDRTILSMSQEMCGENSAHVPARSPIPSEELFSALEAARHAWQKVVSQNW